MIHCSSQVSKGWTPSHSHCKIESVYPSLLSLRSISARKKEGAEIIEEN